MKVAKLVTVSVTTRVVVEDNASDEQIMEDAMFRCLINLQNDGICDHLESVVDDTEMPFNSKEEEEK